MNQFSIFSHLVKELLSPPLSNSWPLDSIEARDSDPPPPLKSAAGGVFVTAAETAGGFS